MTKKLAPFILLIVLAGLLFFVRTCRGLNDNAKRTDDNGPQPKRETTRSRGFNRKISYLDYTQHAKCRMKCRHITQAEVEDIMKNGNINYKKSNLQDQPCPTYALEGFTQDQQHVRIVFAQCETDTKVVTCIDLDNDFECDCN
ncbi:DUF4258 domain-containing protein [Chitinophagaceae bacterium 26-R-25]|nr:DUF4258 domain-containing protein [Chitinophagaceae bacterium 26-R-25]